jgi:hypothetical protein
LATRDILVGTALGAMKSWLGQINTPERDYFHGRFAGSLVNQKLQRLILP